MKYKLELIKKMHNLISRLNNEEAYISWISYVPDEPSEEDFKDIASDNKFFYECTGLFIHLVEVYANDGLISKK